MRHVSQATADEDRPDYSSDRGPAAPDSLRRRECTTPSDSRFYAAEHLVRLAGCHPIEPGVAVERPMKLHLLAENRAISRVL